MYDTRVVDDFTRRLSERVRYLRTHDSELERPSRLFAEAVIHDLEQSAEELRVTGEELKAQGDLLMRSSRAMEAERARFARLFDLAPDPCIVTDTHGGMLEINRAAAQLLGMNRGALQRKPLASYVAQESARDFRAALVRLGRMEGVKDLSLRLNPRSGGEMPVVLRAAHLPAQDGEDARIIWALRNQSDLESLDATRKDLARERESREVAEARSEQARYLVNAAAELGGEDGPEGVAARAARLAADFCDYAVVDLIDAEGALRRCGAHHYDERWRVTLAAAAWPGSGVPGGGARLSQALEGSGPLLLDGVEPIPGFSEWDPGALPEALRPTEMMLLPLLVQGRALGVLWVVATSEAGAEQLKAWVPMLEAFASYVGMALANALLLEAADLRRAAAEESSRGRTRAMAGLSHELRTPLHSILGYSELLLEGVGGRVDEKCERFVTAIRSSALHQAGLVDDILSLARPGRALNFSPAPVRIHDVVRECVVMVRERARRGGVGIEVDVPPDATLVTDRSKLSQVLINLVGNAVKFTERGEVTVRVTEDEERVTFDVRDTGCGIAPTELPHIFEPFWQGSASERRGEGAGLGLSLVRRLVGMLGGEVSVESQEEVGSLFRVELPKAFPTRL